MKKILFICLSLLALASFLELNAQLGYNPYCSPRKVSDFPGAVWAIDGEMTDWQNILGPSSNNFVFPFGVNLGANASYDSYGSADPDNPFAQKDIRVSANISDDKNLYFYFRRLHKGNTEMKAFYFFDGNLDGLLTTGEPVVCINFTAKEITRLSLGHYVSSNSTGDRIARSCVFIDGFDMPGSVIEYDQAENIPLLPDEIFSAATTENGYGIEIAVPWRFVSQYKYLSYHLALQGGAGMYAAEERTDNAGGCSGGIMNIIGSPDFEITNTTITTIIPGLSYRISVDIKNLTPVKIFVTPGSEITLKNIVQNNNLPVNASDFSVNVAGIDYTETTGSFDQQPISFLSIDALRIPLNPFATGSFNIDITFPANQSVQSLEIGFTPASGFYFLTVGECGNLIGGGGGKPINPIGLELGDETNTGASKNKTAEAESKGSIENRIRVYPNPSSGNFNIVLPYSDSPLEMILTDYTGKLVRKWSGVRQSTFRIENLKQGFYLLNVYNKEGRLLGVKKLISH